MKLETLCYLCSMVEGAYENYIDPFCRRKCLLACYNATFTYVSSSRRQKARIKPALHDRIRCHHLHHNRSPSSSQQTPAAFEATRTAVVDRDRQNEVPKRTARANAIDDLDVEAGERHDCKNELWNGELEGDVPKEGGVCCGDGLSSAAGDAGKHLVGLEGSRKSRSRKHNQRRRRKQEERDVSWRPVGEKSDVPVLLLNPRVDARDCASAP